MKCDILYDMLRFYYSNDSKIKKENDHYFTIINNSTLIFPHRRTSVSVLQYVEYSFYYKSRFHGTVGFLNTFPRPKYTERGEFVRIKNKFFIMLDEGSIYA